MTKQITLEEYLLYSRSISYHFKVHHDLINREIRFTLTPEDQTDMTLVFTLECNRPWAIVDNTLGLGI